jgi:hypothetical protein
MVIIPYLVEIPILTATNVRRISARCMGKTTLNIGEAVSLLAGRHDTARLQELEGGQRLRDGDRSMEVVHDVQSRLEVRVA